MRETLELSKNEQILMRIRRSYVGLVPFILAFLVVVSLLFGGVYAIGRYRVDVEQFMSASLALALLIGLCLLLAVLTYIGMMVYLYNKIVITNESVVQVLQHSLFSRKISQLSLARVEDVTVRQQNFIAHLFNYGTLNIETAGEQINFVFPWAKEPFKAAQIIIEAQERLQKDLGPNRDQRTSPNHFGQSRAGS
ncbi:MAG: PH domain-containing protein [Candidatus Saccharimonadales bacterium]